jgi:hypothetical protein
LPPAAAAAAAVGEKGPPTAGMLIMREGPTPGPPPTRIPPEVAAAYSGLPTPVLGPTADVVRWMLRGGRLGRPGMAVLLRAPAPPTAAPH